MGVTVPVMGTVIVTMMLTVAVALTVTRPIILPVTVLFLPLLRCNRAGLMPPFLLLQRQLPVLCEIKGRYRQSSATAGFPHSNHLHPLGSHA